MISSEYHEGHTCPKQDPQRVDVAEAIRMIEGCRVFVTTREKIKHPEGTDLFDESVRIVADALPALLQQVAKWQERSANNERLRCELMTQFNITAAELRDAESKLAAQAAEIERAREQLAECFRIAGGDTDCCQSSQVARAVEVVTDLRQCYDERGQELIAAERAREEACGLIEHVGELEDSAQAETDKRMPATPLQYKGDPAFSYGYWLGKTAAFGDVSELFAAFLAANGGSDG